jgi:peptidoglycan/LPS O-acetylase OafA/YrhL
MASFTERYCGFATGLMPFAAGAVVCHYRSSLSRLAAPWLSVLVWCAHGLVWLFDDTWPWTYGLWVSVPLSAWVVLSLIKRRTAGADQFAGDLSYPVYLLHTTAAAWFLPYFGFGRGLAFCAVSLGATFAVSWCMLVLVDRPMQLLRNRIGTVGKNRRARPNRAAAVTEAEPYEIHTGRGAVR